MSVNVEYISSPQFLAVLPAEEDPFRHESFANSHNHHELHPWGSSVQCPSKEFDALYAQANNQYMYHLWYTPGLAPHMATEVVTIQPLTPDFLQSFMSVLRMVLESNIDAALQSDDGLALVQKIHRVLEDAGVKKEDRLFVRLSATSAKDSFAINVPTAKPPPLKPDSEVIARRILTSGRCVARLLSLSENAWPADPGEALVFLKWAPDIRLENEFRVFCYKGHVTAVSQDIWWEPMGWRERYSEGFVESITSVWDKVKGRLPFETCTMDVSMKPDPTSKTGWDAAIIEFGAFGKHLNTGSDLFHWVRDASILEGNGDVVTLRFVDDWENAPGKPEPKLENVAQTDEPIIEQVIEPMAIEDVKPDWLALEEKLRAKFSYTNDSEGEKLAVPQKLRYPLRGRWCSAY